ncbi:hypothetical protein CgunFtcFv8_016922 [Champsocephalus gunnari]|uniref:Uncharacterized protein n=1 Tax=Champsocephalus gunnari TaxID=52237 RepID=A0AAN8HDU6_CHAGU|nr:hypothetical protein CgunFtcFv8_016922 [Champsocephalus gunnari]
MKQANRFRQICISPYDRCRCTTQPALSSLEISRFNFPARPPPACFLEDVLSVRSLGMFDFSLLRSLPSDRLE